MNFLSYLKNNRYVNQIATLASGTSAAHLITMVTYLIITQLYDPVHIGDFSFFHSASVILVILGTLTYEYAIVLPKAKRNGLHLFALTVGLCLLFSLLLYLIFFPFANVIAGYFNVSGLVVFLIPLGVLFIGTFNALTYWLVRTDDYKSLSYGKILQSGSTAAFQIFAGLGNFLSLGMIGGYLGGRFAANVYLLKKGQLTKKVFDQFSFVRLKALARKYSEQPKFISFSRLLSQGAIEIPVFLISFLFNNQLLGFYGLAYRLLSVPSSFLGTSVGHVSYKHFTERFQKGEMLTSFLLKTWGGLFIAGLLPMFLILFFGEDLFAFVFGEKWVEAGTIAAIMAPVLLLKFVTAPTEKVLLVLNLQKVVPFFSFIDFAGRVSGLLIGYLYSDFYLGIIMMTVFQGIAILLLNSYILYQVYSSDQRQNRISTNGS